MCTILVAPKAVCDSPQGDMHPTPHNFLDDDGFRAQRTTAAQEVIEAHEVQPRSFICMSFSVHLCRLG